MSVVTGERLTANPILTGPRHDRIRALLSLPPHFMKFMITIYYEVQALFQVKMYHLIKSYNGDATTHHRHRQNGLYHFFL